MLLKFLGKQTGSKMSPAPKEHLSSHTSMF